VARASTIGQARPSSTEKRSGAGGAPAGTFMAAAA
jgi:hypothetical protein